MTIIDDIISKHYNNIKQIKPPYILSPMSDIVVFLPQAFYYTNWDQSF